MCSIQYMIRSKNYPNFYLRTINENDIENLRLWKNANRKSFFFDGIIDQKQQQKWYDAYLQRENDTMFIIEEISKRSIGCMGFRLINDNVCDIYNVIRGCSSLLHTRMSEALKLMLSYIFTMEGVETIQCDVLKNNAALSWYKNCGFIEKEEGDKYFILEINKKFIKIPFGKEGLND